MKALSGKDLSRTLERRVWILLQVHGSHPVYGMPGARNGLLIPIHGNRSLQPGMLHDILNDAGLAESDLECPSCTAAQSWARCTCTGARPASPGWNGSSGPGQ